jgi:hypothetical protein
VAELQPGSGGTTHRDPKSTNRHRTRCRLLAADPARAGSRLAAAHPDAGQEQGGRQRHRQQQRRRSVRGGAHPTPRSASVSMMPATWGPVPVTCAAVRLSNTSACMCVLKTCGCESVGGWESGSGRGPPEGRQQQVEAQRGLERSACQGTGAATRLRGQAAAKQSLPAHPHPPARSLVVSTRGREGFSPWRASRAFCGCRVPGCQGEEASLFRFARALPRERAPPPPPPTHTHTHTERPR